MSLDPRVLEEVARMADFDEYRAAYADHPSTAGTCGYRGCRLSLAEHHRLAYGVIQENAAMKRRIAELEHGRGADGSQ